MIKLICGDCLAKMKDLKDNSIDTIITDPPYGLKFRDKKWDYEIPSVEIFQEMLRVAKPGATLLCFAGSRTQHRMVVNIEDAGWILKDCILWIYGSGFPKATDISKGIDKNFGKERKVIGIKKDISHIERGDTNINDQSYRRSKGVFVKDNTKKDLLNLITEPSTPEAQLWDGWKSHSIKPAYEPIILAMKPNDQTYVENALKWGVSGLNIDGSRIETNPNDPIFAKNLHTRNKRSKNSINIKLGEGVDNDPSEGRFPANIILDREASKILDDQSGMTKSKKRKATNKGSFFKKQENEEIDIRRHTDQRGASRYFKIIDQADRFVYTAKVSKKERNLGCDDLDKRNDHPTIKPISLIQYLCTLTKTPTGGIVLDPFMGSGTTGMACLITNRDFIGIEIDPEYYKIAQKRIKYIMINQKKMQREYKLELIKKKRRKEKC